MVFKKWADDSNSNGRNGEVNLQYNVNLKVNDLVAYLTGVDERDRCFDELRRTGLRLLERDRERDFFFSSTFSGLTDLRKSC